jgi:hypothetical protein
MALKQSPSGTKFRNSKCHSNKYHSITDGDRIHRKRQLILKHPQFKERKSHYLDELQKIENSLQKREKIRRDRASRYDFIFY